MEHQSIATETEMEVSDEDIVEVMEPNRQTISGTYAIARPRETLRPLPVALDDVLPRLGSIPDGMATSVSDVIEDLARLADVSSVPRIRGAVEWSALAPYEAWVVTMLSSHMSVEALMQVSPLGEEATLRLLAELVSARVITVPAAA